MYQKLLAQVKKEGLFESHQKVLVAVSGGVDSMNLLHFLHLYQKELEISIAIAHINHGLREESQQEENYLREWSKQHNVPIYVGHFTGVFSEQKARDFRYEFFREIMDKHHYTALVTAHHADDQVETLLMRIIRGSRLRHLTGIKKVQPFGQGKLIRPFLNLPKNQLPDIFHFEDGTNVSDDYFRNRVRNHYIPQFKRENPQFNAGLVQLAEDVTVLQKAIFDLTSEIDVTGNHQFQSQTPEVQNVLLQNYLSEFPDLQLSRGQFSELLELLRQNKPTVYPLKNGYYLHKSYARFEINKSSPIEVQADSEWLEIGQEKVYRNYHFSYNVEVARAIEIPLYSDSPILLRPRQEGDRINFGRFSKKLRRLFIDNKVPIEQRKQAIVGYQDDQIIFVLVGDKSYLRKASESDIMRGKLYCYQQGKR